MATIVASGMSAEEQFAAELLKFCWHRTLHRVLKVPLKINSGGVKAGADVGYSADHV